MRALFLLFFITFVSLSAVAAGGGDHHEGGIPNAVYWQAFNLVILIAGLVYFSGPGIRRHFVDRRENFLSAANRARQLREQAENENKEIKLRLNKISVTESDSIGRAEADAIKMKAEAVREAQEVAARIRLEAAKSAQSERERARRDLKESVIAQATDLATQKLQKSLTTEDHNKLVTEFITKAQTVKA
ncbi:MAG: hypothetical protein AB7O96_17465 [Pseudobdellovibrionaceae bacterium]